MRNTKLQIKYSLILREFILEDVFSNLDLPIIILNTNSIQKCLNGCSDNATLSQDVFLIKLS